MKALYLQLTCEHTANGLKLYRVKYSVPAKTNPRITASILFPEFDFCKPPHTLLTLKIQIGKNYPIISSESTVQMEAPGHII